MFGFSGRRHRGRRRGAEGRGREGHTVLDLYHVIIALVINMLAGTCSRDVSRSGSHQ